MQRIDLLRGNWEFCTDSKSAFGIIGAFIVLTHHEERGDSRTVASFGAELQTALGCAIPEVLGVIGPTCLKDGGTNCSDATTQLRGIGDSN